MNFNPCIGKCTKERDLCEGCGRSREEITEMKKHVVALVNLAKKMEYENPKEFANAVASSIKLKLKAANKLK